MKAELQHPMKAELQQLKGYAAEFIHLLKIERNLSPNTLKAYSSDMNCFFVQIPPRWGTDSNLTGAAIPD